MIPIKKDITQVPDYLHSTKAESCFKHNKRVGKFEKGEYNHKDVKDRLKAIYKGKCAYCEDDLRNQFGHVEHYRPKDSYFWLALSWANLLYCCEICNNNKRAKFKIANSKVAYKNETLSQLHNITKEYDISEKPLLINPENETNESLKALFTFNLSTGEVVAKSERMEYTIETCGLNRVGLREIRLGIRNEIVTNIKTFALLHIKDKKKFVDEINSLFDDTKSFSAWRNFIKEQSNISL